MKNKNIFFSYLSILSKNPFLIQNLNNKKRIKDE